MGDVSERGKVNACCGGVSGNPAIENLEEPPSTETPALRWSARDTWAAARSMMHIMTTGRPM